MTCEGHIALNRSRSVGCARASAFYSQRSKSVGSYKQLARSPLIVQRIGEKQHISLGRFHAQRVDRRRQAAIVRAEISYVMVKPDGVQRGLVGEIIGRFERKGFTLKGLKMFVPSRELAEEHYKDLSSKPFFGDLVSYIISGPVIAMVWEGDGVVASARKIIGATNPLNAEPGTIRGDLAMQTGRNVVHGSDSPENGERETALWFGGSSDLVDWTPALGKWIRE